MRFIARGIVTTAIAATAVLGTASLASADSHSTVTPASDSWGTDNPSDWHITGDYHTFDSWITR